MFERFDPHAHRVIVLAQEEARALDHNYIGTEHILLGLAADDGLGHVALTDAGIELPEIREALLRIIGRGEQPLSSHIPFTPRAKKILEFALREAVTFGHSFIGSEHLLLALITEGEGVAAQIMTQHGLSLAELRASVLKLITEQVYEQTGPSTEEVIAAVEARTTVPFKAAPPPQPLEHGLVPMCPRCKGAIEEVGAYKTLEIPEDGGNGKINVLFVYCEACGYAFASKILDP